MLLLFGTDKPREHRYLGSAIEAAASSRPTKCEFEDVSSREQIVCLERYLTRVTAFSPTSSMIEEIAHARFPSAYTAEGLVMRAFRNREDGIEHLALVKGDAEPGALIRVH